MQSGFPGEDVEALYNLGESLVRGRSEQSPEHSTRGAGENPDHVRALVGTGNLEPRFRASIPESPAAFSGALVLLHGACRPGSPPRSMGEAAMALNMRMRRHFEQASAVDAPGLQHLDGLPLLRFMKNAT